MENTFSDFLERIYPEILRKFSLLQYYLTVIFLHVCFLIILVNIDLADSLSVMVKYLWYCFIQHVLPWFIIQISNKIYILNEWDLMLIRKYIEN